MILIVFTAHMKMHSTQRISPRDQHQQYCPWFAALDSLDGSLHSPSPTSLMPLLIEREMRC